MGSIRWGLIHGNPDLDLIMLMFRAGSAVQDLCALGQNTIRNLSKSTARNLRGLLRGNQGGRVGG